MRSRKYKTGVTLIEMLIVVAVIAILVTSVITVTRHISSKTEIKLAEGSIAIITAALEQFADYGYRYTDMPTVKYSQFKFPLDCNGLYEAGISEQFSNAVLNVDSIAIVYSNDSPVGSAHDVENSGSEILYFFLTQVPASRETINQLDNSLITNKDENNNGMFITISVNRTYPLYRIVDPWGRTLHYDYYDEYNPDPDNAKTFPVITSAGPDRKFDTADDITSR